MTLPITLPVVLVTMVAAGVLASVITVLVRSLAERRNIIDRPEQAPQRKHQLKPVPLLGGLAIYITFVIGTIVLWQPLTSGYLLPKHIIGLWLAGLVIMFGGFWDDWKGLRPQQQIIFPFLATLIIIMSGIGIDYISNPFGGIIGLEQWNWKIFSWNALPYHITLWADLFTLFWLMTTSYTTKILDGLDGLVPGVGILGALIIALVSFQTEVAQPETGLMSLLFASACIGFLLWNFSPAKIYLGEGGSLFVGFMLGVLAIISGGKIATALLILGLPMVDVLWVIIRRLVIERRSPFSGDRLHLHFQLKQLGWSDRRIVLFYYGVITWFGLSTIWLNGKVKVVALVGLGIFTFIILVWLYRRVKYQHA